MNVKSLLPFRPGAYVSNDGGFILLDVLAAVTVSLILLIPALILTMQTENVYSRVQTIHQSVLLAREGMECVTGPPDIVEERVIDGVQYQIRHSWSAVPDGLQQHRVEVINGEETACTLVSLCPPPEP